jgi:hypothetical protein
MEMQARDTKYTLELEKEKQRELILENQRPEDIKERLTSHQAYNRNFKKYVNLTYKEEKTVPESQYRNVIGGSFNTIDYRVNDSHVNIAS